MDRSIIDAASGCALGYMTPFEARIVRVVHNFGTDAMRQDKLVIKFDSLTTLVTQLVMNQRKRPIAIVCGICTSPDYCSDVCPSIFEPRTSDNPEDYGANIYNNRPPQQHQNYVLHQAHTTLNSDKLPSQTVLNPRNVNVITFRSGKNTEKKNENTTRKSHANQPSSSAAQQPFPICLPFPPKFIPNKKIGNMEELDKDLLDTFIKVEVDIYLLDAIKQIPRYAKFLKDLCTHKRKLKGNQRINIGINISTMIGKIVPHIPEKCKDSDIFIVPCIIANKSTTSSASLIEDVLVRFDQLIFPTDFYILDMEEGSPCNTIPTILRRPFFRTARTKIDVHVGTLSMEFDDKVGHSIFNLDLLHESSDKHLSNFLHDFHSSSLTNSKTCHGCIDYEICISCID
ncbi:hypothetical protein Lal_00018439 [Lupinus albus]|nr:hypothetical protein Lal_00018439 [Lupinus albus]